MKNTITRVIILLFAVCTYAQQGINYTGLIKDGSGEVVAGQMITIQFQILQGSNLTNVYQETHTPTTDSNGIIILNIGEGTPDSGVFSDIDWGIASHYLNTKINTGAGLVDMGTTGFKTVSYALQANTAATAIEADNGIPAGGNEGAVLTMVGGVPTWSGGAIPPAEVGDFRDGGVVFWIDPLDNTHGLVAAIEDQITADAGGIRWSNGSFPLTGASGTAIGTGSANTDSIISIQGEVQTNYAAGLARAYEGGGFSDWFLPSKDELNEMYINKSVIKSTSEANGGAGLVDWTTNRSYYYWSSTEETAGKAWGQLFINGSRGFNGKGNAIIIRAIRAF